MTKRVTVCMDEAVRAVAMRTGNMSGYVCNVLMRNYMDWRGALDALFRMGYGRDEIMSACNRLRGVWDTQDGLASYLFDNDKVLCGIAYRRGLLRVAQLPPELKALAWEWWSDNLELRGMLQTSAPKPRVRRRRVS